MESSPKKYTKGQTAGIIVGSILLIIILCIVLAVLLMKKKSSVVYITKDKGKDILRCEGKLLSNGDVFLTDVIQNTSNIFVSTDQKEVVVFTDDADDAETKKWKIDVYDTAAKRIKSFTTGYTNEDYFISLSRSGKYTYVLYRAEMDGTETFKVRMLPDTEIQVKDVTIDVDASSIFVFDNTIYLGGEEGLYRYMINSDEELINEQPLSNENFSMMTQCSEKTVYTITANTAKNATTKQITRYSIKGDKATLEKALDIPIGINVESIHCNDEYVYVKSEDNDMYIYDAALTLKEPFKYENITRIAT